MRTKYSIGKPSPLTFMVMLLLTVFVACSDDDNSGNNTHREDVSDLEVNPAYLYDINAVPEITLTVTEADWNQYLTNFDNDANNNLYVPAKFTFKKGNNVFERAKVGMLPRGNTSRRRPEGTTGQMHQREGADWHHAHYGIKFTDNDGGKPFFGSDRIVLKWFHGDPAYCRDVFCYDLFHRFGVWSAPYSSFCRLSIYVEGDSKPAYMGVYEMLEGIKTTWLQDRQEKGHLTDANGHLWKGGWAEESHDNWVGANLSDFNIYGTKLMGVSKEGMDFTYSLENNSKDLANAQQELYDFMEDMRPLTDGSASLQTYLEQHMDVDLFLRAMAVTVAVGMWDDYWVNSNNLYFYFDSNHKFHFIPFDYDNTLGTTKPINGMLNSGTQDPLHWGSRGEDRLLIKKVLSIASYENRYKQYLRELVTSTELMEPEAAIARVKKFQGMIADYVANDTGEDMTIEDLPRQDPGECDTDYKLLTGDDQGINGSNYFRTKAKAINSMK